MKRIFVSGASRGIGRAIAKKLAAPETLLLVHGRDFAALEETQRVVEERGARANNPRGHGHLYLAEATIGGVLDERSGALCNFTEFQESLRRAVADWDNRHLDLETAEFRNRPSTGENIVQSLWEKMNPLLWNRLNRLRLWETANNRFTLRWSGDTPVAAPDR